MGYPGFYDGHMMIGSVRGLRAWNWVHGGYLYSTGAHYEWHKGVNLARCRQDFNPFTAPNIWEWDWSANSWRLKTGMKLNDAGECCGSNMANCSCGFYAYYRRWHDRVWPWRIPFGGHKVYGVVEGYGNTVLGSLGFRSSKARILGLAAAANETRWDKWHRDKLEEKFEVPVYRSVEQLLRKHKPHTYGKIRREVDAPRREVSPDLIWPLV